MLDHILQNIPKHFILK